jgi:hypothetical protein
MSGFITLTRIIRDPVTDPESLSFLNEGSREVNTKGETIPVVIRRDDVRCFHPRRNHRPGTRITFSSGGGFPVQEEPDTVAEAMGTQIRLTAPSVQGEAN